MIHHYQIYFSKKKFVECFLTKIKIGIFFLNTYTERERERLISFSLGV